MIKNEALLKIFAKKNIIILIILILIEVFVFNRGFFLSLADKEVDCNFTTEQGEDDVTFSLTDFPQDVKSVFLDFNSMSAMMIPTDGFGIYDVSELRGALPVVIYIKDEGNANYYAIPERLVSPYVKSSEYIPIESFGKITGIKVCLMSSPNKGYDLKSIKVNSVKPFVFSWVRFSFMLLLWLFVATVSGDFLTKYDDKNNEHRKMAFLVSLSGLIIMLVLQMQIVNYDYSEYGELAKAITKGQFYVEKNMDEAFAAMENPYDAANRIVQNVTYKWDWAYYNGYYYVYFGVVPVILFYLPFRLLFGINAYHSYVQCIILLLYCISAHFLFRQLVCKYFKNIPLKVYLMFLSVFQLCSGMLLITKRAAVYYVALGTGLFLVFLGLYFFISAIKADESLIKWRVVAGAVCMAASVGCRPQFALASFLLIAIYYNQLKKPLKYIADIVLCLIPYIIIGGLLMYYNYARFDSPFEFGAKYNLTSYDLFHMGIHLSRIKAGIWYYLMNLPTFNFEFPFIQAQAVVTEYPGYIFAESQVGGMIWCLPVTLLLLLLPKVYKKADSGVKQMINICFIATMVIIVVDVLFCGMCMRYHMDMRLYLLISTFMLLATISSYYESGNSLLMISKEQFYKVVMVLLLGCLIMSLFTVCSQYEVPDYSNGGGEVFYLKLKETLGIFDY